MKKRILLIKTISLISCSLFCAFSYSSDSAKSDCYAQFFDSKKPAIKLPEDLTERSLLLKEIKSEPKKYADMLNLPKNEKTRKQFFYMLSEAAPIPFATEVYPGFSHETDEGVTTVVMETVNIRFRTPNRSR